MRYVFRSIGDIVSVNCTDLMMSCNYSCNCSCCHSLRAVLHKNIWHPTQTFHQNIFGVSLFYGCCCCITQTTENILPEFFWWVRKHAPYPYYSTKFEAFHQKISGRKVFGQRGKSQHARNLRFPVRIFISVGPQNILGHHSDMRCFLLRSLFLNSYLFFLSPHLMFGVL